MTTESARLTIGSVSQLTGGKMLSGQKPRPSFYAIATELEKKDLAKLIWMKNPNPAGGKRVVGNDLAAKLWGIELFDSDAAEKEMPGLVAEPLSQLLRPYQVSPEAYKTHCQAMTTAELATFDHNTLIKCMQNPPPKPTIPTVASGSGSVAQSTLMALETTEVQGAAMEATLYAAARSTDAPQATLNSTSALSPPRASPQGATGSSGSIRRSARLSKTQAVTETDTGAPPASPAAALAFAPAPAPQPAPAPVADSMFARVIKRARGGA